MRLVLVVMVVAVIPVLPTHGDDVPPSGSLTVFGGDDAPAVLPLRHTSVEVEISALVARVVVEQVFENPFDRPIDVLYTFPLGDDAAVDDFELRSGMRIIRGEIHERQEAREIYETARVEGYQVALLEQERPNVFSQNIANLPPAGEITIRIRTVETLVYETGTYEFLLPLVVANGYVGAERAVPVGRPPTSSDPVSVPRGERSGSDVEIRVSLDAGVPIASLASVSHRVEIERPEPTKALITLAPDDRIPNRDFILRWSVSSPEPVLGSLCHRTGVDGYFTFLLQPRGLVDPSESPPKEILFVLDTSGSMNGIPLELSKEFIRRALRTLGERDRFNLIRFAGGSSAYATSSRDTTTTEVESAIEWLDDLESGGGTEMMKGLQKAVDQKSEPGTYRMILFLTDGFIGDDDRILRAISKLPGDVRIFALGIGFSVNHSLLERMAERGRGAYTYISENAEGGRALSRFESWILRPYLTHLEIDWGALSVGDWVPEIPNDLFAGQTLAVTGRYHGAGNGRVTVRGRLGGSYWEQSLELTLPEIEERNAGLASVWARQRIDELLASSPGDQEAVREDVLELALEHRLMSPFTSFVAVDHSVRVQGDEDAEVDGSDGTAGITVEVTDDSGPLAGATVILKGPGGETRRTTDAAGRASFSGRDAGNYEVEVSFPGYGIRREGPIPLPGGAGVWISVPLTEELQERVRVVAENGVIELVTTAVGASFSDEFIQDLPVPGRFYQNVLTLGSGMPPSSRSSVDARGGRDRGFKAVISGVSNVDPLTGHWMSQVNPNSIEEMEVISAGAGIEFSRAQGGFANIIQKQGSNQLEGALELAASSHWLDGGGSNSNDASFDGLHASADLSGPLVKDRLWYRLSVERADVDDPIDTTRSTEIVEQGLTNHAYQLTWQATARNKLALQWRSHAEDLAGLGVSSLVNPEASLAVGHRENVAALDWTLPLSPKILVESSVSYVELRSEQRPRGPSVANGCVPSGSPLGSVECLDLIGGQLAGTSHRSLEDRQERWTLESQATIYAGRFAGASHQVKTGGSAFAESHRRELIRNPSLWRITSDSDPDSETLLARVGPPGATDSRGESVGWSIYVNDRIRPVQNVSVEVGIRVDHTAVRGTGFTPFDPAAEYRRFEAESVGQDLAARREVAARVFTAPDAGASGMDAVTTRGHEGLRLASTNFSPRLSVAWDPFKDSRTSFKLTIRRNYGELLPAHALVESEPAVTNVILDGDTSVGAALPSVQIVDRGLRTPFQDELTLGFESEIFVETVLRLSYVYRNFRDQLQDVEINHGAGGQILNPLWGDVFLLGNFADGISQTWALEITRRQYRSWELRASYVYAVARNSVEAYDLALGDERTLLEDAEGPRSDLRRHELRSAATYFTPWGFRVGGVLTLQSGVPYSALEARILTDTVSPALAGIATSSPRPRMAYASNRNDLSNEMILNVDVGVSKEMNLGRGLHLAISVEVLNLFDDRSYVVYSPAPAFGRSIDGFDDGTNRFGRRFLLGARFLF